MVTLRKIGCLFGRTPQQLKKEPSLSVASNENVSPVKPTSVSVVRPERVVLLARKIADGRLGCLVKCRCAALMRRLEPQAALALPHIGAETRRAGAGWTVTDRCRPQRSRLRASHLPKESGTGIPTSDAEALAAGPQESPPPLTPRGLSSEHTREIALAEDHVNTWHRIDKVPSEANLDQATNATKDRTMETWLNHTLGQAVPREDVPGVRKAVASTSSKHMQGLSHFGIDIGSLEKLGLDFASTERVYRAMFVYSQGLHAVLQEEVSKSKNASQALLVLWRAFTTVLAHAGQGEQNGTESLVALVQRGDEDERIRMQIEFQGKLSSLEGQLTNLKHEKKTQDQDMQGLREVGDRLANENEMYRNENHVISAKYDREIKACDVTRRPFPLCVFISDVPVQQTRLHPVRAGSGSNLESQLHVGLFHESDIIIVVAIENQGSQQQKICAHLVFVTRLRYRAHLHSHHGRTFMPHEHWLRFKLIWTTVFLVWISSNHFVCKT